MRIDFEHLGHPVVLHGFDGDHVTRTIQKNKNFYEAEMLGHITTLEPTNSIVDVGANIGNHSVYFGLFTDAQEVIAIEPYPPAAKLLTINLAANKLGSKVVQYNCAVGAKTGVVGLQPGKRSNMGNTKVVSGHDIELKRLDDIARNREVSIIKIDVEGYELEVVRGAIEIISNQR